MQIEFPLPEKRASFLKIVQIYHGKQVRKYTGEPYWYHLIDAANIYWRNLRRNDCGIDILLGHDLLEDTHCTEEKLKFDLKLCFYKKKEIETIMNGIVELTDVYTTEKYPNLNRRNRKVLEAERLSNIRSLSQTCKYCDKLSNTPSIISNDIKFAQVYLNEIEYELEVMNYGDLKLKEKVLRLIEYGKKLIVIKGNYSGIKMYWEILKLKFNSLCTK